MSAMKNQLIERAIGRLIPYKNNVAECDFGRIEELVYLITILLHADGDQLIPEPEEVEF